MSKHTAGPWNGRRIDIAVHHFEAIGATIAFTGKSEEAMANARLIAAAPDMLAALEAVLAVASQSAGIAGWHLNGDLAGWGELLPEVGEAIVKAKGGKA